MTTHELTLLRALLARVRAERDARARKVEAYITGLTEDGRHHTVSTKWEDYWRKAQAELDTLLAECEAQWPEVQGES